MTWFRPHSRLLPLAVLLFLLPSWTGAEVLTGTVQAINEGLREFYLLVDSPSNSDEAVPGPLLVSYRGESHALPHRIFPGCVRTGEQVRVWGEFTDEKKEHFLAANIRGNRKMEQNDPTGVRNRLRSCRKNGDGNHAVHSRPGKGQRRGGDNGNGFKIEIEGGADR